MTARDAATPGTGSDLGWAARPPFWTWDHEAVADQVYSGLHWAERTDRDLGVAGRYSVEFYDHATRWMVSEVNLHKLRQAGSRDLARMARLLVNARRGRLGMRRTVDQRDTGNGPDPASRGWDAESRATEAW